jgi:hypothetical protein
LMATVRQNNIDEAVEKANPGAEVWF